VSPWFPAIPPHRQHLTFDDKVLDDYFTLADYGIRHGSTLYLKNMIQIEIEIYDPAIVCTDRYGGVAGRSVISERGNMIFSLKVEGSSSHLF
jgi:hypothetical protein